MHFSAYRILSTIKKSQDVTAAAFHPPPPFYLAKQRSGRIVCETVRLEKKMVMEERVASLLT